MVKHKLDFDPHLFVPCVLVQDVGVFFVTFQMLDGEQLSCRGKGIGSHDFVAFTGHILNELWAQILIQKVGVTFNNSFGTEGGNDQCHTGTDIRADDFRATQSCGFC